MIRTNIENRPVQFVQVDVVREEPDTLANGSGLGMFISWFVGDICLAGDPGLIREAVLESLAETDIEVDSGAVRFQLIESGEWECNHWNKWFEVVGRFPLQVVKY